MSDFSDTEEIADALITLARFAMPTREYRSFRKFINGQRPDPEPGFFDGDEMRVRGMPAPPSKVARRRVADSDVQRPAKRRRIHSWRRKRSK